VKLGAGGSLAMQPASSATAHELAQLEKRLVSRFDRVDPVVVHEIVNNRAARFTTSPIQNFVPLLTEKAAVAELKVLTAANA
jgi:hypothetical protein